MNLIKRVQIMPRRYFSFGRSISYLPMKNAESDRVCCMIPISCGYSNIYQNIIICFKRYDTILKLWYTEGQTGKKYFIDFQLQGHKTCSFMTLWLYIFGAGRKWSTLVTHRGAVQTRQAVCILYLGLTDNFCF